MEPILNLFRAILNENLDVSIDFLLKYLIDLFYDLDSLKEEIDK